MHKTEFYYDMVVSNRIINYTLDFVVTFGMIFHLVHSLGYLCAHFAKTCT